MMRKRLFDHEDEDYAQMISDNMAMNSDRDLMLCMGEHMAMDLDSGELHLVSEWSDDEE